MMTLIAGALLISATGLPRERQFLIDYAVSIDRIPTLADRVEVWLPIPHDDAHQSITRLETASDFSYQDGFQHTTGKPKIETGEYGNRMLHMIMTTPAIRSSVALNVQFLVKRREHVRAAADAVEGRKDYDPHTQRWLGADRLVPLDPGARAVAEAAGARSDLEMARAIYDHVVATAKYDTATDAFIGSVRALGIPARFSIGLALPSQHGSGTISSPHSWVEIQLKGTGWVPVDAAEAAHDPTRREYFFGAHDENRVEFSRGRDLTLTPKQHGPPLNHFLYPYVEVDGKPYLTVKTTYRYADVTRKR